MLSFNLFIMSISIFNIRNSFCSITCKPKVAIIGAGIGGASASYFLTELFGKNLEIDIFESKSIGGRLATVEFGNKEFEAGGAIIHPKNRYMNEFVNSLNLKPRITSDSSRFGIWNGQEFVFEESTWELVTLAKLVYRYGSEIFHLHKNVNGILNDFDNIYDHQEKGIGFENVTALIASMNKDFIDLLQVSLKDHLINLGYDDKIINELIKATTVVNYGQDVNLQAFVGYVSIAGAGFNLWSVNGGNKLVPKLLIESNNNIKVVYSTVKKIVRKPSPNFPKYEIFYENNSKTNLISDNYDIVIIACPLTSDQENLITFYGFDDLELKFPGEYHTTIATFVSGNVNFSYFDRLEEIEGILSCDPMKTTINSIGKLSPVEMKNGQSPQVWKIFSNEELNNLEKMFLHVDEVKEIKWKAYPQYSSKLRFDKFKLDDFMYHVNAIEWAASAMEMSAIGGRNVANLAFNDYQQQCTSAPRVKRSLLQNSHSSEL